VLLSDELQVAGSTTGLGLQRTPGGKTTTAKPARDSLANQSTSELSPQQMIGLSTAFPNAPRAECDSPLLDEPVSTREDRSAFQVTAVRTATERAVSAASAETPVLTIGTNPAGPSTTIGSEAGLKDTDATPQNLINHLSFVLILRPQNPAAASAPAGSNDPGNGGMGADRLDVSPPSNASRAASIATASDSATSVILDGATGQAATKRSGDSLNAGLANLPGQPTGPIGTALSSTQMLSTPLVTHATIKPESSLASISTPPTIGLPEPKSPTPQGMVHDVQLRLQGEAGESVSVRLSDRSGQVQISVRSSDQATATTLRQDLSTLSASLEKQGWKTDLSESPQQMAVHDVRDPSNKQQADEQGRQRSAGDWQDPPDRKRQSPTDLWADINEQETT
jgi:hypothetical protein